MHLNKVTYNVGEYLLHAAGAIAGGAIAGGAIAGGATPIIAMKIGPGGIIILGDPKIL